MRLGCNEPSGYYSTVRKLERITRDPAVMGGKPCIRGMRVTVGTVIGLLSTRKTREEILAARLKNYEYRR